MFKNQTQKQLEELEKLTSAIKEVELNLPLMKSRQTELQNLLSAKLGFSKTKSELKTVESDKATETTVKEVSQQT